MAQVICFVLTAILWRKNLPFARIVRDPSGWKGAWERKKVEQVIKKLFPKARVFRADRDAIDSHSEMSAFIQAVESREADTFDWNTDAIQGRWISLPFIWWGF